jgi:hypothetical protein
LLFTAKHHHFNSISASLHSICHCHDSNTIINTRAARETPFATKKTLLGAAHVSGPPKKKSLDFLGFLWPIRDFSMGYGESK